MASKRIRWWIVWALFGSTVINYISRQTFSVLAPVITQELHLSHTDLSRIFSAFQISYAGMWLIGGVLLDIVGTRLGLAGSRTGIGQPSPRKVRHQEAWLLVVIGGQTSGGSAIAESENLAPRVPDHEPAKDGLPQQVLGLFHFKVDRIIHLGKRRGGVQPYNKDEQTERQRAPGPRRTVDIMWFIIRESAPAKCVSVEDENIKIDTVGAGSGRLGCFAGPCTASNRA